MPPIVTMDHLLHPIKTIDPLTTDYVYCAARLRDALVFLQCSKCEYIIDLQHSHHVSAWRAPSICTNCGLHSSTFDTWRLARHFLCWNCGDLQPFLCDFDPSHHLTPCENCNVSREGDCEITSYVWKLIYFDWVLSERWEEWVVDLDDALEALRIHNRKIKERESGVKGFVDV